MLEEITNDKEEKEKQIKCKEESNKEKVKMTKSYKAKEIEIVKASCNAEDMSIEDLGETID